jgi:anaerobic selenocysteine-containing dehydrogenase
MPLYDDNAADIARVEQVDEEELLGIASGDVVRVITRTGKILEGTYRYGWALKRGGFALTIKPRDGSWVKHVTTVHPITVLPRDGSDPV